MWAQVMYHFAFANSLCYHDIFLDNTGYSQYNNTRLFMSTSTLGKRLSLLDSRPPRSHELAQVRAAVVSHADTFACAAHFTLRFVLILPTKILFLKLHLSVHPHVFVVRNPALPQHLRLRQIRALLPRCLNVSISSPFLSAGL